MITILVAGGAGFIGSNFVGHLLAAHRDVRVVTYDALTYAGSRENLAFAESDPRHVFVRGDIRDIDALRGVFEREGVTHVVNFAAESHVDRSIASPLPFVSTNVDGTAALLAVAREAWSGARDGFGNKAAGGAEAGFGDEGDGDADAAVGCGGVRFLQISTDEVYGTLEEGGLFDEASPLRPRSPYSASKASADLLVHAFAETYGLPAAIVRCSNNFGPYQLPEKLIPRMILCALAHEPLPLYGDGLHVRDWLYVRDACRAIDAVLRKASPGSVYNVSGRNERTNAEVVRFIVDYLGKHVDEKITDALIAHVADRPGHDRRYGVDSEKIRRDLGWAPETAFEEGLARTIEWYLAHGRWMERAAARVADFGANPPCRTAR